MAKKDSKGAEPTILKKLTGEQRAALDPAVVDVLKEPLVTREGHERVDFTRRMDMDAAIPGHAGDTHLDMPAIVETKPVAPRNMIEFATNGQEGDEVLAGRVQQDPDHFHFEGDRPPTFFSERADRSRTPKPRTPGGK